MRRTLIAVSLLAATLLAPGRADAAGDTTHGLMADRAIGYVVDPQLEALLHVHRDAYVSGAHFPDAGYWTRGAGVPGGDYGEVSHWERFINAYIDHLRAKPECGVLTDPLGPCAPMVAHLLGAAAHGMGDEMWDWLFEPLVTDHGEVPDHPIASSEPFGAYPPGSLITSIEYAMDMRAIVDHFLWSDIPIVAPPADDLVEVYRSIGRDDITKEAILAGFGLQTSILAAERFGAAIDGERVKEQMPWSSAHYYSESGGVIDTAQGIAGYLDAVWRKLNDPLHPAPQVVAVHPEHGERGVPMDWHPAKTSPGPHTGGGEQRILAVLSNSLDASTVAGAFHLYDPDGVEVPALAGFPKAGPYGAGDGTHSMLFYPAVDLEPCTVYTAVVTTALRDHAAASPRRDFSWRFETESVSGAPC